MPTLTIDASHVVCALAGATAAAVGLKLWCSQQTATAVKNAGVTLGE
jgi:hypothetical protein